MSKIIFFLLVLVVPILCDVSVDNVALSEQHCPTVPPVNLAKFALLFGNRYQYAQQRFGPPIVAEKCWRNGLFLSDFNLLSMTLNSTITFYDPRDAGRQREIEIHIMGLAAKGSFIHENKEIIGTKLIVTPKYNVELFCRENMPTVMIWTDKKERDEKIIQEATEAAKKLLETLPSPAVNMKCNELP